VIPYGHDSYVQPAPLDRVLKLLAQRHRPRVRGFWRTSSAMAGKVQMMSPMAPYVQPPRSLFPQLWQSSGGETKAGNLHIFQPNGTASLKQTAMITASSHWESRRAFQPLMDSSEEIGCMQRIRSFGYRHFSEMTDTLLAF